MKSPHTVAHRESLAYKMFVMAAEARDRWLRKPREGHFSATVQRYFTGMSLSRYILLVCVEFPIVLAFSLATWLCFPVAGIYVGRELLIASDKIGGGEVLIFGIAFVVLGITLAAAFAATCFGIVAWAGSRPSFPIRFLRKHVFLLPTRDMEDLEKFPGPIALVKKWILSNAAGTPSQITWDSGRKRRL